MRTLILVFLLATSAGFAGTIDVVNGTTNTTTFSAAIRNPGCAGGASRAGSGSIAPGATWSFDPTATGDPTTGYDLEINGNCGNQCFGGGWSIGSTHTYYGNGGCGGPPPVTTNYYCVYNFPAYTNNNLTKPLWMGVYDNDTHQFQSVSGAVISRRIDPGQWSPAFSFTNNVGTNPATGCPDLRYANQGSPDGNGDDALLTEIGPSVGPTKYGTPSSSPSGGPGPGGSSNGPIVNGPSGPGSGAGGSTNLYTQGDGFKVADSLLKGLGELGKGLRDQMQTNSNTQTTNIGRLGTGIATNLANLATNIADNLQNHGRGIGTNLSILGDRFGTNIASLGTNLSGLGTNNAGGFPTNLVTRSDVNQASNNALSGMVHSLYTNVNSSWALSSNAQSGLVAFMETSESNAGSVSNAATGFTGGSSTGLEFAFSGSTLNLDPEHWMPGVMGIVKAAWTFVLLCLFALWAGKKMMEVTATLNALPGGGVPNIEFTALGTGGNIAGVALALLIPVLIITLSVAVLNAVYTVILSWTGLIPSASSALGLGGNPIALYLLNGSFPVSLFFSLLSARITLQFTAAKLVIVSSGASRWLFNK